MGIWGGGYEMSTVFCRSKTKRYDQQNDTSHRGVFGQKFDPLVFENFSKFTTKRAKMTVKE